MRVINIMGLADKVAQACDKTESGLYSVKIDEDKVLVSLRSPEKGFENPLAQVRYDGSYSILIVEELLKNRREAYIDFLIGHRDNLQRMVLKLETSQSLPNGIVYVCQRV